MNQSHFKTCPCGTKMRCSDSRSAMSGPIPHLRRRYICPRCGYRMTTAEFVMPEREGRNTACTERFLREMSGRARAEIVAALHAKLAEVEQEV